MRRITRALALLLLALATATNTWGQGSGPAPSLTLLSREGRRAIPITVINNQDYVAVDDLAGPFATTSREAAGGLTITAGGTNHHRDRRSEPWSPLPAGWCRWPPRPLRRDTRWLVPLDFLPRALGPVLDTPARSAPPDTAAGHGRPARPAHRHAHRQRQRERVGDVRDLAGDAGEGERRSGTADRSVRCRRPRPADTDAAAAAVHRLHRARRGQHRGDRDRGALRRLSVVIVAARRQLLAPDHRPAAQHDSELAGAVAAAGTASGHLVRR